MGLLSSIFGSSSSSASTTTSTSSTSNTTDNRVATEGEGLALGQGAQITVNNPVTDQVVQLFGSLVTLATDAIQGVQKNASDIYQAASTVQQDATLSQGAKDVKSYLPYAGLAVAAFVAYVIFKK